MRTFPPERLEIYEGKYFCDNCAKEFEARADSPVRFESEDGTLKSKVSLLWMFCSEQCRDEFKERE